MCALLAIFLFFAKGKEIKLLTYTNEHNFSRKIKLQNFIAVNKQLTTPPEKIIKPCMRYWKIVIIDPFTVCIASWVIRTSGTDLALALAHYFKK